jgi:hypothetical protein
MADPRGNRSVRSGCASCGRGLRLIRKVVGEVDTAGFDGYNRRRKNDDNESEGQVFAEAHCYDSRSYDGSARLAAADAAARHLAAPDAAARYRSAADLTADTRAGTWRRSYRALQ